MEMKITYHQVGGLSLGSEGLSVLFEQCLGRFTHSNTHSGVANSISEGAHIHIFMFCTINFF